jgi:hypothetical protein
MMQSQLAQGAMNLENAKNLTGAPETPASLDVVRFEDLIREFTILEDQLSKASDSMMSTTNLLDSRRSIQEAKTVTRLTELAFVFIPLTFSATLFGMQIEQFNDRAPLSTFILIALTVTIMSYAFRLIIRSQTLSVYQDMALQRIVRFAKDKKKPIKPGQPVPTNIFLRWAFVESQTLIKWVFMKLLKASKSFWKELWSTFGFIITSVFMSFLVAVTPCSVIMTRDLDPGIKKGVSAAIIISTTATVTFLHWGFSEPKYRSAFPRKLRRVIVFLAESGRIGKLCMWITSMAGFCIALATVWRRELSAGIKAGVTAFVITSFASGILIYLVGLLRSSAFR